MDENNKNYIKSQIRQNINKTKHNQEKSEENSEVEHPESKNQQSVKQQKNNNQNQSIDKKSKTGDTEYLETNANSDTESDSEELNPDNRTTDQFLVILESVLLFLLITVPGFTIFGLRHILIFFVYLVLGFIVPIGYYSYKKLFPKENNIFGRTVILISVFLFISVTIFLKF